MLKTKIFAGSITNLTDARYFAARGAQYLSFNLDTMTDLTISAEKTAAIKEWVEGPLFIGAFQMASLEDIRSLVEKLQLHLIQTGPLISLELLKNKPFDIPMIREIIIEQLSDFQSFYKQQDQWSALFDYILINFEKNGLSWANLKNRPDIIEQIKNWNSDSKVIIAINHRPAETQEILDAMNPYGLYLQGGEEEKIGYKSYDDLDEIFDSLELEESW